MKIKKGEEKMKVISFKIENNLQIRGVCLKAENRCKCGCSPNPFVLISDGKKGMSVRFQSIKELNKFKKEVNELTM